MRRIASDKKINRMATAPMLMPAIAPVGRLLVGTADAVLAGLDVVVLAASCVADVAEGIAELDVAELEDETVVVYKRRSCG